MRAEQMELMTSLFLCALLTLFPTVLGESIVKTDWELQLNGTKLVRQKPSTHKILLNINGPPLVNIVSELQTVFADRACHKCIECMERAVKAHRHNSHLTKHRPSAEEIQSDVLSYLYEIDNQRKKRSIGTKTVTERGAKKSKQKTKQKKNVTVTRYDTEREIYALKVNEVNTQELVEKTNDTSVLATDCQVFSVKKYFPCDTPEADLMLTAAKRKVDKKNRREKEKNIKTATSERAVPIFRKRQVDNSQVPENVMPSVEEMY